MTRRSAELTAVLGGGLIGGSLALALRRAGQGSVLYDIDPGTRQRAREAGLDVAESVEEAVHGAATVVLGAPVDRTFDLAEEAAAHMRQGAVLGDVGSLKAGPVRAMRRAVTEAGRFDVHVVGTHPMAGKAQSGFEAAEGDLFDGCTWVLTPAPETPEGAVEQVRQLTLHAGAGRVVRLDAQAHDSAVAACSHAVQGAASALAGAVLRHAETTGVDPFQLAAGGWRDTTRVAASPAGVWTPILVGNAANVAPILREVAARLNELADAAEDCDEDTIRRLFEDGNAARRRWEEQ